MHNLQKEIIKRLILKNGQAYSELTKGYDADDNVAFHVKQLMENGFITKDNSKYKITPQGIYARTQFDLKTLKDQEVKSFFIGYVCKCENDFLIKPHNPGTPNEFYNLPSGKPFFGENLNNSLTRLFFEETNLSLKPNRFQFDSLHMKTVKTKSGEILFDDAYTVYVCEISLAEKQKAVLKRNITWMNPDQIKSLPNKWPEIDLCILRENRAVYNVYEIECEYL
jgi:hypothetical protein